VFTPRSADPDDPAMQLTQASSAPDAFISTGFYFSRTHINSY